MKYYFDMLMNISVFELESGKPFETGEKLAHEKVSLGDEVQKKD